MPNDTSSSHRWVVVVCFLLSGISALVFEVLWIRQLTLVFGHTALATAAVLTAFMAGLALGSYFGGRAADRMPITKLLKVYALLEALIAVAGWLSKPVIGLAEVSVVSLSVLDIPIALQHVIWFSVSFSILVVPTALMGVTLPVITRWMVAVRRQSAGSSVGLLYGINTFQSVDCRHRQSIYKGGVHGGSGEAGDQRRVLPVVSRLFDERRRFQDRARLCHKHS